MQTQPATTDTRRLPLRHRPWSKAQRLLAKHHISQQEICDATAVPLSSVNRALSFRFCGRTQYAYVIRVRRAVEQMLADMGENIDGLWADYDFAIKDQEAS